MPWLPIYANKDDSKILLKLLNEDQNVAFIVSNGKKRWKAVHDIESLDDGRYCIWHVPSGQLPLLGAFKKEGVQNSVSQRHVRVWPSLKMNGQL